MTKERYTLYSIFERLIAALERVALEYKDLSAEDISQANLDLVNLGFTKVSRSKRGVLLTVGRNLLSFSILASKVDGIEIKINLVVSEWVTQDMVALALKITRVIIGAGEIRDECCRLTAIRSKFKGRDSVGH